MYSQKKQLAKVICEEEEGLSNSSSSVFINIKPLFVTVSMTCSKMLRQKTGNYSNRQITVGIKLQNYLPVLP